MKHGVLAWLVCFAFAVGCDNRGTSEGNAASPPATESKEVQKAESTGQDFLKELPETSANRRRIDMKYGDDP